MERAGSLSPVVDKLAAPGNRLAAVASLAVASPTARAAADDPTLRVNSRMARAGNLTAVDSRMARVDSRMETAEVVL